MTIEEFYANKKTVRDASMEAATTILNDGNVKEAYLANKDLVKADLQALGLTAGTATAERADLDRFATLAAALKDIQDNL